MDNLWGAEFLKVWKDENQTKLQNWARHHACYFLWELTYRIMYVFSKNWFLHILHSVFCLMRQILKKKEISLSVFAFGKSESESIVLLLLRGFVLTDRRVDHVSDYSRYENCCKYLCYVSMRNVWNLLLCLRFSDENHFVSKNPNLMRFMLISDRLLNGRRSCVRRSSFFAPRS